MSLRRRLVVGMLVLLVVGLVTTDVVTTSSFRSFLLGRLDDQIDQSQSQAYRYLGQVYARDVRVGDRAAKTDPEAWISQLAAPPPKGGAFAPATRGTAPRLEAAVLAARLSSDTYVEIIDEHHRVVFRDPSGLASNPDPAPVLPRVLPTAHASASRLLGARRGPYVPESPAVDVGATGSGVQYRVHAVSVPGGTLVTAISLDPTDKTLASLIHVEVLVSIVVIIALLLLVLWVVRLGMRPLDDITETAGAIAGGDLTRRIRRTDKGSEVGRLGTALNGMLSQIEAAFAERTASESRLRRFVADASHELRTPLTSIRGYAELLRKGAFDSDEARRRAAERIEGEAARMSLLVDDLLLLARLDQGRPLDQARLDLRRVVADAVDAAAVNDGGHTITLEGDDRVMVEGDAARLRQIVDNLLRNAVVHTPAGTPVHVRVRQVGADAVLRVSDEGPGLDAEQAARVFDRFYRGSEARTGDGTGLGLSIVAALAAAHGGRATVETSPGRGASFTVEIPAATTPTAPGASPPSGVSSPHAHGAAASESPLAPSVRR